MRHNAVSEGQEAVKATHGTSNFSAVAYDRSGGHFCLGRLTIEWRALAMTFLLQTGLLSLLISSITVAAKSESIGNAGISVFDLTQSSKPSTSPLKPVDAVIVPPPVARVTLGSIVAAVQPSQSAVNEAASAQVQICNIASSVGQILETSESARGPLLMFDNPAEPISRATMLWDEAWITPPFASDQASLSLVHQSVIEAVSAAPPECRAEMLAGPQFIMLDGVSEARSIILVVGSGKWSWEQLLTAPKPGAEPPEDQWSSILENEPDISKLPPNPA
jgi:hypothetical protein